MRNKREATHDLQQSSALKLVKPISQDNGEPEPENKGGTKTYAFWQFRDATLAQLRALDEINNTPLHLAARQLVMENETDQMQSLKITMHPS